jgi:MFS transporter, ACDE family, multidrug resistance protein
MEEVPISCFFMQASESLSWQRFSQLFILLGAGCLTTMTGTIVAPIFPEMLQQLQLEPQWAGLVVSMHSLTTALSTPLLGILADRIGKSRVMIPCLIAYAVFGAATMLGESLPYLLVTRGLLGTASGGITAAAIGILSSLYEGEARARILGYATSAMTVATVIWPLIGGWIGSWHWQYVFFLYGLGLPLAAIAIPNFMEQERGKREGREDGQYVDRVDPPRPSSNADNLVATDNPTPSLGKVLRNLNLLRLYLLLALVAVIINAVVIYAPIYLKTAINAGPELNGMVLAIRAAGAAFISAVGASWLANRLGERRAIALGFLLMALALITLPWLTQLHLIILMAIGFGAGLGIILPNVFNAIAIIAPEDFKASVLAIGTGFKSLGHFVSPLILGIVWEGVHLPAVFYTAAGLAIVASYLSLISLSYLKEY